MMEIKYNFVILLTFITFDLTYCDKNRCSSPILSGLHYDKTEITKSASQKWLAENYERLKSIQFIPTTKEITPQGILPLSHSRKEAEDQRKKSYSKAHITNDLDYVLHNELDKIERLLNSNPKKAHNRFKKLYTDYKSPRALFGMARALNKLAMRTGKKSDNLKDMTKKELEDAKKKRTEEPTRYGFK